MAIDLFCYVSKPADVVNSEITKMRSRYADIFEERFLAYDAKDSSAIHREIAIEYGIDAKSVFMVSLNDKSYANKVVFVSNIINKLFGSENILILHGNSTPM